MKLLYNTTGVGAVTKYRLLYTFVSDDYGYMYNVRDINVHTINDVLAERYIPSPSIKHQLYSLPIIAENFNTIEELMHLIPEYFI
jgi:hypothetical protein